MRPIAIAENQPVDSYHQGVVVAYHKPYGVVVASEGDGPGGVNTVMAWHPASGTIVVGFTNIFGLWGETEFILDEIFSQVVIAE